MHILLSVQILLFSCNLLTMLTCELVCAFYALTNENTAIRENPSILKTLNKVIEKSHSMLCFASTNVQKETWAPSGMSKGGHLLPQGNIVECFYAANVV